VTIGAVLACAILAFACAALLPAGAAAAPPSGDPNGLVGWSVYRHLNQLPEVPAGVREYEISSYDRAGGNDDGGRFGCLFIENHRCVIAQHTGPGEIGSIWFTSHGGDVSATGKIKIVLDGRTVLDAPVQSVVDGELGAPFTYPLVANAELSSGGVYIQIPMPFRSSMRVSTDHNPDYYHVFYRTFASPRGVRTFNRTDRALDVLRTLRAAGYRDPKPATRGARTTAMPFQLAPGAVETVANLRGPGAISSLRLQLRSVVGPPPTLPIPYDAPLTPSSLPVPDDAALDAAWALVRTQANAPRGVTEAMASVEILHKMRLLITFDGHRTVDSPLGEFFGSGLGDYPVHALMFAIDGKPNGWLSSWWPMPYRSDARIQLANFSRHAVRGVSDVVSAHSEVWNYELSRAGQAGYFTATSRAGQTTPAIDWPFLQERGRGELVGISQTMDGPNRSYLEGDDIGYIDGARSPQLHGTGTEDFYEGGWYWNRGPFTDPLNGEPAREEGILGCPAVCDSGYRLMIADAIPFTTSINYGIEHGNQNTVQAAYSSTAFSYQRQRW
jgi:hypothetical protein